MKIMTRCLCAVSLLVFLAGCTASQRVVQVRSTGMTDETAVIQHAINSCPKGGVVELTRGTYISGSLYLKSDMTLKIDHGATIKGTENDGEYPIINTRIGGLEMPHPAALINAIDCQHTCITGEGTIDGSGKKWWDYFWKMRQQYGRGIDFKVLRPRLVCFTRCQDSSISKLTLQNPPFWTLHLLYSNHIRVDGLTIRAPRKAPSSDGIDVDSSNDISIAHCDIACDDDNISVKAGRDADGLRVNKPSENITIRDCHFGAGGGVAMGSETAGGIRHVLVDHCTFDGSGAAVRIKSMPGCGGVVEDITYQNITAKNVRSPIEINLTWGGDDWKKSVDPKFAARVPAALGTPHVRNIHILNLSATDCPTAGIIYGLPNSPISDVQFVNVHISSDRGLGISHTDNLNFNGLTIQTKIGPAIVLHSTSKK